MGGCSGAVTHSPVEGKRASLGLTAEDHLPVPLQSLHRIHDAAGLLGEDGTLQDTASCGTTGRDDAAESEAQAPACLAKRPISRRHKQVGRDSKHSEA